MDKHEKYVTIEYDVWHNHYKDLDKENKYLRTLLDENYVSINFLNSFRLVKNGTVVGKLDVHPPMRIKEFNTDLFLWMIRQETGVNVIRTDEEKRLLESAISAYEKVKKLPRIVKWLLRIKI